LVFKLASLIICGGYRTKGNDQNNWGGGGGMEKKDDLSITASFLTHDVWFINKDLNWFHTSHLSYDQLSLLLTKLIS